MIIEIHRLEANIPCPYEATVTIGGANGSERTYFYGCSEADALVQVLASLLRRAR